MKLFIASGIRSHFYLGISLIFCINYMVRKMKVIFKKGYWVLILEHHHEVRIERHYRENQVYKGLENIGVNLVDFFQSQSNSFFPH